MLDISFDLIVLEVRYHYKPFRSGGLYISSLPRCRMAGSTHVHVLPWTCTIYQLYAQIECVREKWRDKGASKESGEGMKERLTSSQIKISFSSSSL